MPFPLSGTPAVTGSPEVTTPGSPKMESRSSNTFDSLKSLFKPQYPQKKCKICGKSFSPKQVGAIAEAHKI